MLCAYIHPPSPEAVLCIVVGMAYMLTQAWSSVMPYTHLPIPSALPRRVRRPASFTFAPELMLVNCHINSDLLVCFVNNINYLSSVCDSQGYFCFDTSNTHELSLSECTLYRLPKGANIHA